ncbi:transglutaminase-like cysteine peptidase [Aminobacter sp. DSM 101952]|uniref:transglutaminase-like cysteine peptidase n=1 Tax=Aminobacter sp. DSM 101952 TaxID=2735891 RepID=UPI0009EA5D46|nr:transglutaminase-like cysteine peptidase [Aminobacter sp. DSM 101952]
MKATSTNVSKLGLNIFAAATLLAIALPGAHASEGSDAEAATLNQPSAMQLLGGLMLPQPPAAAATSEPFQFGPNFDGYSLAVRTASQKDDVPAGIDPIKTAAIVPGVFGSVAIPMRNFPVAGRWAKVYSKINDCAEANCGKRGAEFAAVATGARDKKFMDKLASVNRAVNTMIAYRQDDAVYGNLDYWAKPAEILSRGVGDCEDYVILKMAALIEAGVPARSMSLVVLKDTGRGVFHAVLSVATQSGNFILDNLSNTVAGDDVYRSYVPLYSFSTDRAWIHGARSGSAQIASVGNDFTTIAPGEGPVRQ